MLVSSYVAWVMVWNEAGRMVRVEYVERVDDRDDLEDRMDAEDEATAEAAAEEDATAEGGLGSSDSCELGCLELDPDAILTQALSHCVL